jgi:hypothetical protein
MLATLRVLHIDTSNAPPGIAPIEEWPIHAVSVAAVVIQVVALQGGTVDDLLPRGEQSLRGHSQLEGPSAEKASG